MNNVTIVVSATRGPEVRRTHSLDAAAQILGLHYLAAAAGSADGSATADELERAAWSARKAAAMFERAAERMRGRA